MLQHYANYGVGEGGSGGLCPALSKVGVQVGLCPPPPTLLDRSSVRSPTLLY